MSKRSVTIKYTENAHVVSANDEEIVLVRGLGLETLLAAVSDRDGVDVVDVLVTILGAILVIETLLLDARDRRATKRMATLDGFTEKLQQISLVGAILNDAFFVVARLLSLAIDVRYGKTTTSFLHCFVLGGSALIGLTTHTRAHGCLWKDARPERNGFSSLRFLPRKKICNAYYLYVEVAGCRICMYACA